MIQFVCDACGKVDDIIYAATLEIPRALSFAEEFGRDEYQLCHKCAAAALKPPVLEVGKKYKARDPHGNVGEVEIAEITVMKEDEK